MFGISRIFRSRWAALLWAAGIVWFAVDFVAPDDPGPAADTNLVNVPE